MEIVLPPIDIETADPNVVGELLREITFVTPRDDDFGCYTTFEVRDDASRISDSEREDFWRKKIGDSPGIGWGWDSGEEALEHEIHERLQMGEGWWFVYQDLKIECHWYWDGDGVLYFKLTDPNTSIQFVNSDCKKNYGWRTERWA